MQLELLKGIFADAVADFVESLPVNREPVVMDTGLSEGYLRIAPGITGWGTAEADRGGINWNGACYRVMGTKLVRIADGGARTEIGDVGSGGPCWFDYSFDRLAIGSGGRMYYFDGTNLIEVTDPDLGVALDGIWVDGYFMTTDGSYLVVTELNDPTSIDPLKYGSAEEDPDPINGLIKVRGEVYALNRYTIENFVNSGSAGFPFLRNSGALIPRGCVGTFAKAPIMETFAFVGGGRNEAVGVYLAGAGDSSKISTRLVDTELAKLTEAQQAAIECESRVDSDEQRLLVHLPDKTLVYYAMASKAAQRQIWAIFASGVDADEAYRGRSAVQAYGKWIVADSAGNYGYVDPTTIRHFGAVTGWRFDTALIFNDAGRGIINTVELTGLAGRGPVGSDPRIFMSWSIDGLSWSQERAVSAGKPGQKAQRIQWRPNIRFNQWIGLRFRGADDGRAAFARLDAAIQPLGA